MKAIVYERYGGPDMLTIKELPKPTPKDSEVRIRVRATIIHTEHDTPDKVDPVRLVETAHVLRDVIWRVDMLEA